MTRGEAGGLRIYAALLRRPHVARFLLGGVLVQFPYAMVNMALLIGARDGYGSYSSAGLAAAVIGAGLLVGLALGPGMRRALQPVLGAGGAPLTVYTAHVLAFAPGAMLAFGPAMATREPMPWWLSSPWLWLAHLAGALVIGALIGWSRQRGPLEQLVTATGRTTAWMLADPDR